MQNKLSAKVRQNSGIICTHKWRMKKLQIFCLYVCAKKRDTIMLKSKATKYWLACVAAVSFLCPGAHEGDENRERVRK